MNRMTTISEALSLALQHHHAGRLREAEPIYRKILAAQPDHAEAWHLLGVIAHQVSKHEVAIDHIKRAIQLAPTQEGYYNNLGEAYRALGRTSEATACYRSAIQLRSEYPEAHNNWGINLAAQGELDEAIACYTRAIQLRADYVEAHNNLGNVLKDQGKSQAAIACYKQALELEPQHAGAHYNLGIAEQLQGRTATAFECFSRAIERKPDFAEAYYNLANIMMSQRSVPQAIASYRRATELKPDFAEAHYNLGIAWQERGNPDAAVACFRRAWQVNPAFSPALIALVHGLQHLCHWDNLLELSQRATEVIDSSDLAGHAFPVLPFYFLCLPLVTPRQQLKCAQQWVNRQLHEMAEQGHELALTRSCRRCTKPKLTIGYLSSDFHSHATALLIAGLFEQHDRSRYNIIGYSYGPDDGSPMRRRLEIAFDRFVDLQTASFAEAARRIAEDDVDILVDLKGYTGNCRSQILALRPAPIQVNYLGYPGTMGASFIDYILVDEFLVSREQQPYFTEQLVYLPGCYQVNDSQRAISPRFPSRTECGLPEDGFVFCSFNNCYKITPEMFDTWMQLLRAVSGSILWLLDGNRFAPANLRREAEARGVAGERLVFAPRLPPSEHLARHRLADLFLDTFPVNAHTTASDALWAGCPVLTLAGETFASRVAGSLLKTIGLPQLITTSFDEYRRLALRLAQDPDQLAELRARLNATRETSSLFDTTTFARSIERAYDIIWEKYVSGENPTTFWVGPPA